ncbi:phospholipid carrier-dependent glycosyltransferase [Streptomyces sp. GESEQ-35]|uniref:phospholipid carrier-dependent glycosyltransferase n=1 Tax=Streptomyces sp. GESEQ-35 TaxID=2812657 RepID=UPI001B33A737|nr:phospholipid carrier-dependent glycosyltransferase [Streptomyces sp. GESEQ-35]
MAATTARQQTGVLRAVHGSVSPMVPAAAACVLTVVLRLVEVGRSSDLFVDELIYLDLGRSAGEGGLPRTDDGLFFLHPPGFFYLQAAWAKTIGLDTDVVSAVYGIRVLNALLAGATAAVLVLLVARVRSQPAGLLAGLVFALDPYCIRQNNRAMLETETMLWVLAGYLVLIPLARTPLPPRPRARAMCAGLLFGMAITTKDHSALITMLPLLLAIGLRWGPPRRLLLLTATASVVPYSLYLTVVAATGHFDAFRTAKMHGTERLLGFVQETGFNAPGTPSLAERLTAELPGYASTYVLLLLTPVALALLLRRKDPEHRLLALFHGCAILTLAYALALGTLEEQALYLLFVPNLIALAVVLPLPLGHGARGPRFARRVTAVSVLAVALVLPGTGYATERLRPDDGFAKLRAYMLQHVPAGSAVTTTDGGHTHGVTRWALKDRYRLGSWASPGARAAAGSEYVVVPWKIIEEGYGRLTTLEVKHLTRQGDLVFSFHGRSYGVLALYRLPLPDGATDVDLQAGPGHEP